MACKKCKRLPKDLSELEYLIVDEIDIIPFSYDKYSSRHDDKFISLGQLPKEIANQVKSGNTVNYNGKYYTLYLDTDQVCVQIDNEQKFKGLYDKYQYIIDYFIKNKGKIIKRVDIPAKFDCSGSSDEPYFPCIQSDDSVELYICQTINMDGGSIRYRRTSYSYSIHLATLTLRDPRVTTTSSSISDTGETIVTTTTRLTDEKPRELTQVELLNSPRSEIISRWYNDKGNNIYKCKKCKIEGSKSRPFSHIFHNFKYVIITKVTPCSFSVTEHGAKEKIHHSKVPLKVKGVLEIGMSITHDGYTYSYENDRNNEVSYHRIRNEVEKALEYYNKYFYMVQDLSKYIGVVIKPKELIGITKNVYAENVPVIYMGNNIGLIIKKKSGQMSKVLTTLATIEFQIVFA